LAEVDKIVLFVALVVDEFPGEVLGTVEDEVDDVTDLL
jgi:hypothetical protein